MVIYVYLIFYRSSIMFTLASVLPLSDLNGHRLAMDSVPCVNG
jgi:hypothetical protein